MDRAQACGAWDPRSNRGEGIKKRCFLFFYFRKENFLNS